MAETTVPPVAAKGRVFGLFYGWWIVAAGAGIQLLTGALLGQAFGAYVVLLREEFGWSKTVLSAASSLREAESGIMGPVQGWLLDVLGPRRVVQIGLVIFAGGFLLFSQVHSLELFFAAFFIMSIGASLCGYLSITFAAVQWFERRRATAIALTSAGFAVGGIAVRITVVSLEELGWRETAVISAVILLVVGLPLAQVIRFRPSDHGLRVDGDPEDSPALAAARLLEADGSRDFTLREAMRTRAFWFVSFGHASALFIVSAMNVHLISHLIESLDYSLGFAATISTALPVVFLVGTLLGGPIGDRFNKRWLVVLCMFMHAGGLLLLAHAANVAMVMGFMVLHGLGWGFRGPQMAAIRADYFGRSAFATILGVSNLVIIIGTISGPVIAGYMYDQTGNYRVGFDILAVMAAAGSIFFVLAPKPARPRVV
jgi:sugar phosphate permease